MNILQRAQGFVQSLLHRRQGQGNPPCPHCGRIANRHGTYPRRPRGFAGQETVRVQRYRCPTCDDTFSESPPDLVPRSHYKREVHRCAIDHWLHGGTSLRRTAEFIRSWLGHQERWLLWRPWDAAPTEADECHLSASTVHRWLDRAGVRAQAEIQGQMEGLPTSGQFGTDGMWARLRGQEQRVILLLTDSVTGLIWPPIVACAESLAGWEELFLRALQAGLDLTAINGLTSDGSMGLLAYLQRWGRGVHQQRCVFHIWRNLAAEIVRQAAREAKGLAGAAAEMAKERMRQELEGLMRGVIDATSYERAEAALMQLLAHPRGTKLGRALREQLDELLMHLMDEHEGLIRITPEWLWRDFRLRLSRGRNHGSAKRLERAALVWAIYHNFTPTQRRLERKRQYKHPGQSALEVAGIDPGRLSYLDALGV